MSESLYSTLLLLHSYWRWIVLVVAVGAIMISYAGWMRDLPAKPWAKLSRLSFIIVLDLQFLLGLLLYLSSPLVREAWKNFGAAMKDADLRFYSVEHTLCMIVGLALAHIGSARCKRMAFSKAAHLKLAIWYSVSLIVIVIGTPWSRPLFRMLSSSYE